MTFRYSEILLCTLFLFLRPLGAGPFAYAATSSSSNSAASAKPSAKTEPEDSGDDQGDDEDDDDDDDTPASATAKAGTAKSSADDSDDDDDDDDDDSDDYDYEDLVDLATKIEDSGKAISGNVTLASDYILRGLSQTDHQPAIQGGFDYNHPTGAYLGLWGSNVHFDNEAPSLELDFYGGYGYRFNKDWRVSLGIDYLSYFKNENRNSWDFPARLEWKTFSFELTYSPSWEGLDGDSWYFLGGWSDTLVWNLTFGAYVGYSVFTADAGVPNYWDFRVTVSHPFYGVDLGIAGVFVSDQEINDANGGPRAIFSISKAF